MKSQYSMTRRAMIEAHVFYTSPFPPPLLSLPPLAHISRYRVLFYSQMGQLVARLEPYSNALGARSLSWSPDGSLLAVGSYDQCARLISPVNWKAVAVLRHVHPKNQVGVYMYYSRSFSILHPQEYFRGKNGSYHDNARSVVPPHPSPISPSKWSFPPSPSFFLPSFSRSSRTSFRGSLQRIGQSIFLSDACFVFWGQCHE